MTTKQLSRYLLDEDLCERYLREVGILKTFEACPACSSTHFDRIRRQRYMCYECRYEWNIRRESILEGSHLNLSVFIACLKFFSDDMPATKCALELEISHDTVSRVYSQFRRKLLGEIMDLPDSSELSIYIMSVDKQIIVGADILRAGDNASNILLVRSIDKDRSFKYFISYKNLRVKNLLSGMKRIDELDDFYRYCQERLLTFRGRDIKLLLWKLHELAFRYNNRHKNIFDILISKLQKYSQRELLYTTGSGN